MKSGNENLILFAVSIDMRGHGLELRTSVMVRQMALNFDMRIGFTVSLVSERKLKFSLHLRVTIGYYNVLRFYYFSQCHVVNVR